ncbi:MAG: tRNA pseudouridine(55) synthase TruB, partial [Acidimicrobiales bacterium]
GWTSHDVVARARKLLSTKKVGHSGTLDPDATGVLVLGIGRATRLLQFLTGMNKSYVGEIRLGSTTTTLDAAGEITANFEMGGTTVEQVRQVAKSFVGDIEQIPPMVSALKIDGKRLHELAREGIEVERKARPVTISRLDIDPVEGESLTFRAAVDCSSGTYIRTLAADIGEALGGGAHLRSLRRTAVGPFTIADATPLEALAVLPAAEGVRSLGLTVVDDAVAIAIGHGKVLPLELLGVAGEGPWPIVDTSGRLLAVYKTYRDGEAKPALVLAG